MVHPGARVRRPVPAEGHRTAGPRALERERRTPECLDVGTPQVHVAPGRRGVDGGTHRLGHGVEPLETDHRDGGVHVRPCGEVAVTDDAESRPELDPVAELRARGRQRPVRRAPLVAVVRGDEQHRDLDVGAEGQVAGAGHVVDGGHGAHGSRASRPAPLSRCRGETPACARDAAKVVRRRRIPRRLGANGASRRDAAVSTQPPTAGAHRRPAAVSDSRQYLSGARARLTA